MVCVKCGHILPEDSEFCQYCGTKLDQSKKIFSNSSPQPTENIPRIDVNPVSVSLLEEKNKPIEIEQEKKFTEEIEQTTNKKEPSIKKRYCSKCGSLINNETKRCSGCGKQYFKGIKLTKFSISVIALTLIIVVTSAICISQALRIQDLIDDIFELEDDIELLEDDIEILEDKERKYLKEIQFFNNNAEIVPNDDTNLYHKWGCKALDLSSGFFIFNTKQAISRDYTSCPYCH